MKELYIHKHHNICQDINMLCRVWLRRSFVKILDPSSLIE